MQGHKVEELYLKSLKILQSLYGECHMAVATCLINLGSLYEELGNFSKAEEFSSSRNQ